MPAATWPWWISGSFVLLTLLPPASSATEPPAENPFLPPGASDVGWPFVRGPHYDGHSAEIHLADRWPEHGPPVLWSRTLGQGYSAFIAVGDRVYTQAQTIAGQVVVCLDADTGKTLWEYNYDWRPYEPAGVYPGPRATPTFAKDRVYFATPDGLLGCLHAATGKPLWSLNLLEKYAGRGVGFGYACSPTVIEGRVIMPVGGKGASMVAFSADTGAELWKAGDDPASYTPAYPLTIGSRAVVLGYLENSLVCHDIATGERLWRHDLSHGYDEHSAWPIYREPYLWISGPFRVGSQCWRISSATGQIEEAWQEQNLSNDVLSSVCVGEHVYGFDVFDAQAKTQRTTRGLFRCLALATGKVCWSAGEEKSRTIPANAPGHAAVIAADGKLILLNDQGELILARANPDRYEELARATVLPGEAVWTPPILHRGRLYLRDHSRALCVYVGQPDLLAAAQRANSSTLHTAQPWLQNWTKQLLPYEPEYAFDVPQLASLGQWYFYQLCLLLVSTGVAMSCSRICGERFTMPIIAGWAFVLGAFGTTLLSRWQEEFIFTWPLSLYAVFHIVVLQLPLQRQVLTVFERRSSALLAVLFLVCMALYFWLCRRLCLLFEWSFLTGFPATLPIFLGLKLWVPRLNSAVMKFIVQALSWFAGFSVFYWASAALLWLRYGISG